jgi:hypothetical protein
MHERLAMVITIPKKRLISGIERSLVLRTLLHMPSPAARRPE